MSLELLGFIILSAGLLASAAVVVVARNPIHSAISLVVSFFFLAALYLTLNASFVAVIQVLVYAGAIMVLFLFVIMLLNLSDAELGEARWNLHKVLGTLAVLVLIGSLFWAIAGAQEKYLDEPGVMRSTVFERLASTAGQHGFGSQAEQQEFVAAYSRLRIASLEKLRLKHGTPEARESACQSMSSFSQDIDPTLCDTRDMQMIARGVVSLELSSLDRKLAALEASVDDNPVPSEWRGERAERIPSTEPTRYERAVLLVVDIISATLIDQATDRVANRVLTFDQRASLDALARSASDMPSESRSMSEVRALATAAPGERYRVALERAVTVADLAREEAGAAGAELVQFDARLGQLRAQHRALTADVLTNLRAGRKDLVIKTLSALQNAASAQLTASEQKIVRNVVSAMSSNIPPRVRVTTEPAVYNKADFGTVQSVGRQLFTKFLLPFEVASVLLLVAIIGAVVIAKRRV